MKVTDLPVEQLLILLFEGHNGSLTSAELQRFSEEKFGSKLTGGIFHSTLSRLVLENLVRKLRNNTAGPMFRYELSPEGQRLLTEITARLASTGRMIPIR